MFKNIKLNRKGNCSKCRSGLFCYSPIYNQWGFTKWNPVNLDSAKKKKYSNGGSLSDEQSLTLEYWRK